MINPIKFIKRIYYRIKNLDPVLKCPVYKKEGCSHVVMEVSSQSLKLHRVDGIDFDTVAFLNLCGFK